jgi:hypothetical protein
MSFEGTTLGNALGAGELEASSLLELSEEHLMLIHGGNSDVNQASIASRIIEFVVTEVLTDIAPAESPPPRDLNSGQQGRGGDDGGSGAGGAPGR